MTEEQQRAEGPKRRTWAGWIWFGFLLPPRILLGSAKAILALIFLVVLAVALVHTLWISPRDFAYRFAAPGVADGACEKQAREPALLAVFDNSEDKARARAKSDPGFECMLQRHTVPVKPASTWPGGAAMGAIEYYLSFLEFQENGRAAQKGLDGSALLRSQLDVLEEHLARQKRNYVVVFVHGWRKDARIGDDNVANARVFAAHAASFLDYRCRTTGRYCGYTVTMVYVGWRGARVDERAMEASVLRRLGFLGDRFDSLIVNVFARFPALLTLFDRKPISERIAPSVVSALRHVDRLLKQPAADGRPNRMLVVGHSLGGNILATGLNGTLMDLIRRHNWRTRPGAARRPRRDAQPSGGGLEMDISSAGDRAARADSRERRGRRRGGKAVSVLLASRTEAGRRFRYFGLLLACRGHDRRRTSGAWRARSGHGRETRAR